MKRHGTHFLVLAFITISLSACAAKAPGPGSSHEMMPRSQEGHQMHGEAQAGQEMEHAGHVAAEVKPGVWSYLSRKNPEPYKEKRWEMVPVPKYGHMYVNTGKLSQNLVCGALRENPAIMVDRATRKACGLPETPTTGVEQMPPMRHEQEDERPPHREHDAMHEYWTAPEEAAKRKNPVPAAPASIERGGKLFEKHCVLCHGPSGRGDGPAGASLTPRPPDLAEMAGLHPPGDLAWKIENGRGPMPAWKGILTETEIWDLVNFILSLGR